MFTPRHSPHPSHPATGPDDLYDTKPPWDIDRPQAAFVALAEAGNVRGRVLDIGCGTGEHALMAAGMGYEVVGVDQSARALELAERKATKRGVEVRFIRYDACQLADLNERFDTVLDCLRLIINFSHTNAMHVATHLSGCVARRWVLGHTVPPIRPQLVPA